MKLDFERDSAGHPTTPLPSRGSRRMDQAESPAVPITPRRGRLDAQRASTIRVQRRYHAPPGRIFDSWLDPDIAGTWLFATASQPLTHVNIDARVGGSFRFTDRDGAETIEFAGRYVEIVPDRRLVFTLCNPRRHVESRVVVAIAPRGTGCVLELIHQNLSSDEARYLKDRWTGILYGLGITLDSIPQRSTTIRSRR